METINHLTVTRLKVHLIDLTKQNLHYLPHWRPLEDLLFITSKVRQAQKTLNFHCIYVAEYILAGFF